MCFGSSRRTGYAILLSIAIFLSVTARPASPLKDFKKDVKKEQARDEQKKKEHEKTSVETKISEPTECGIGCQLFSAIFSAIGQAWIGYNTSIYYDDYPYAGKTGSWATFREAEKNVHVVTVKRPPPDPDDDAYEEAQKYRTRKVPRKAPASLPQEIIEKHEITESIMPDGKRTFVNVEAAGLYLDRETYGLGGGFQARLLGWFGLIGEYRQYRDKSDKLVYSAFGTDLALVQAEPVSWSFYLQYNAFSNLFALSGYGYGMRLQWFTGAQTVVDVRIGKMEMTNISFWDYDLRFGVFVNRVQIFAGYRAIESAEATLAGLQSGVQVWF